MQESYKVIYILQEVFYILQESYYTLSILQDVYKIFVLQESCKKFYYTNERVRILQDLVNFARILHYLAWHFLLGSI